MSFTDEAWARTAALRAAVDGLDFLTELGAGTLAPETFRHYLEQDTLYLEGYAKALALLASRAPNTAAGAFWATSAAGASVVEASLHEDLLTSGVLPAATGPAVATPATLGYVSYLVATAATAPYAVGAAAVLPCFWIYADVGRSLAATAAGVGAEHPYRRWVLAYDDPEFHASVDRARALVDAAATPKLAEEMHTAFATAARYEYLFWAEAHDRRDWPLGLDG
ncbi:TenA family protein [Kineococcus gynurae]|uniref:TenA family protein n=1 Tax=Kineococcus gynurae TaxID=452979 RepID=A0ABV5LXD5_9ACTN